MAPNSDTFWQHTEEIVANTAETISLSVVNYLRIDWATNNTLYLKFNWDAGDTEVSATNFDVSLTAADKCVEFQRQGGMITFPKFANVRVICAVNGVIGFMGW